MKSTEAVPYFHTATMKEARRDRPKVESSLSGIELAANVKKLDECWSSHRHNLFACKREFSRDKGSINGCSSCDRDLSVR